MTKPYQLALHIFRRDLRLHDNTALICALQAARSVIAAFIFDPRQVVHNNFKSESCLEFMAKSLQELDQELQLKQSKLYCFYGVAEEVVDQCLANLAIQAVYINRDYTPFSRARDSNIAKVCADHEVDFHCYADALLNEPEHVLKHDHSPYTIFTSAFKKAREFPIASPKKNNYSNYYQGELAWENKTFLSQLLQHNNPLLFVKGGRREALTLLKKVKLLIDYEKIRNFPALEGTSKLSAHNKFGTLSIREFYAAIVDSLGKEHPLLTELYWRDFFTHIIYHFPFVLGRAFHEKYVNLPWSKNKKHFDAWCEGKTGFPIVDAGMRQLNTTGYMHNRIRMIVASFLTKDLHIDWQLGEKYFAQKLVDYDPAVNNGNWQWAASTGCDAQPYFRIFNPWIQQQKFDPDCEYIKRFIPELTAFSPKMIHGWYRNPSDLSVDYPAPIVDHGIESQRAKLAFRSLTTSRSNGAWL